MSDLLATPGNMRKLSNGVRTPGAQLFAYSPRTFERYSATPDDYFMLADDEVLTDSEGEPMVLAYAYEEIAIVENAKGNE